MSEGVGGRRALALVGALLLLAPFAAMPVVSTPAPPGGTHRGYQTLTTSSIVPDGEKVPVNFAVVVGPEDAWRVAGNTLQAVRVAGTIIELVPPSQVIDLLGDRLMGLCFLPEQTINSGFYSGFFVNEAPIVEFNLGTGLNLLKLQINVPQQVLFLIDQVGNILGQLNLPDLGKLVQFNQWTCVNVLLNTVLNLLTVILGNTLDNLGHVVNGALGVIPLNGVNAYPRGSIQLLQPAVNTGRVVFRDIHLQTSPDVPLSVQGFAGPDMGQVTLTWDPPVADGGAFISAFKIYRGTSPDFAGMQLVGTVVGGYETEFVDTPYNGLVPTMQKYFYRVTAVNMVGEGPLSLAACRIPYPLGLLILDNTGLGCGSHGLVEAPMLEPIL